MLRSALLSILLPLLCTSLGAQQREPSPLLIGPYIEQGVSFDAASVPVFGGNAQCGVFDRGNALISGLGATLQAPHLFSPSVGFGFDIVAQRWSGTLTARPVDPQRVYEAATGTLIELDEHYQLASSWWSIVLRPTALVRLSESASLLVSPLLDYRFGHSFSATDHIEGPGDYRFEDGSSVQPLQSATSLSPSRTALGATLGVVLDLPLGSRTLLQPRCALSWSTSSPVESYGWSRLGVMVGVSLLFASEPSRSATVPPRTALAGPVARLEINGVDTAGQRLPVAEVLIEESNYRRHAPLLPAIFFERGMAPIPARYRSGDTLQTQGRERRIADRSLLALQHRLLAIVARRMQERPSAHLILSGSTSSEEEPQLARARADAVKRHLGEAFGIDSGRITTTTGNPALKRSSEATEQGREDNRRVEFGSDDPALLAPIVVEWTQRSFTPPSIVVEPHFSAEAGVRSWEVTVTQAGEEVAHFGEAGESEASSEPEFTWRIVDDKLDSTLAPMVAVLRVVDSNGIEATDTVTTPLVVQRRVGVINADAERNGERERVEWTLIGFDFNEATMREESIRIVDEIAASVKPSAEIRVTGTTDVIGSSVVNTDLALRRARATATLLQSRLAQRGISEARIILTGAGEEAARFGDSLPEARLLSRGVEVVVEQSAEP